VKNRKPFLILLGLALNVSPSFAQEQTNDAQQKAVEMLRQMINERERRRGAALPQPAHAVQPTNMPAKAQPATVPAKTQSMNASPKAQPTFAEIEQLYLQGKITARQFQQYLQGHNISVPPKGAASAETEALALEVLRRETAKANAEPAKTTAPAGTATLKPEATAPASRSQPATDKTTPEPEQTALTEVEKKMDELLRLKAAREQAALTNAAAAAATNSAAGAPKTKRQRLDELLKLHIDGKLSEAEYNEKRNKIIAEP
jgi:hypothetical protein